MSQEFDIRQSRLRDLVTQIGSSTDLEVDKLLRSIDVDLVAPLRMVPHSSQVPPRVNIQGIVVTNPLTGRKHTIPPISNLLPNFASWTNLVANVSSGSQTVTVTQTSHGRSTGDIITVSTAAAIGGITAKALSKVSVAITVTGVNTFTYTADELATSTTSGSLDMVAYGGSIALPASNGGSITVSPTSQAAQTLTITSNYYIKIGVFLDSVGNLSLSFGTEGASISAATAPAAISGTFFIGFFVAQNVGGTIQPVLHDHIYQFGSGGGGSGQGDTYGVLETFKNMLVDSPYSLMTPYIAASDQSTLIASYLGASYSTVDSAIKFNSASDNIVSTQLLDSSEFLTESVDVGQIDLAVEWKAGSIDTGATYEISRDNGGHYQTITMSRVGNATGVYQGLYKWDREEEDAANSVATAVTANSQNLTNNSGTRQALAQKFTVSVDSRALGATLYLSRTSTFTAGSYRIAIYNDNSGVPGSAVAAGSYQAGTSLTTSAAAYSFTTSVNIAAGTYWVVIETDDTYKTTTNNTTTNVIKVHGDTTIGTNAYRYNAGWSAETTTTWAATLTKNQEAFDLAIEYAVGNETSNDDLDSGSTRAYLSQAFTLSSASTIKRVQMYLNKVQSSGTVSGNLFVAIYKDNSGSPSSASDGKLGESSAIAISSISTGAQTVIFDIPNLTLAAGTYHIVLRADAAYKASYSDGVREINWRSDATLPPVVGKYSTDGSTWSALTGNFVYRIDGRPLNVRLKITSSAGNKILTAFALFYNLDPGQVSSGVKKRQVFRFNGNTENLNSFAVTNFQVDSDLVKVFRAETGECWVYPAFNTQGQTVVFPTNTFYSPVSNTVTLVVDQNDGSSFDNSDLNAKLMAANHLGSTDSNIDKSVAGRGVILRRPDGTLRELALDNSDNITILSVP